MSEPRKINSSRQINSNVENHQMASSYTEIAFQSAAVAQNQNKNQNKQKHINNVEDVNDDVSFDEDDKDEEENDGEEDDDEVSSTTNPNNEKINDCLMERFDQMNNGSNELYGNNNYGNKIKHKIRPATLFYDKSFPYDLEGTVRREGDMTHYVAENLEYKIKLASPVAKREMNQQMCSSKNSTPSTSTGIIQKHFLQSQLAQIDSNVLSDIEIDAQYLAASVDNLTENLYNLLHSISSITADNVEIHKNSVNKLTDSMDSNIKCMYTIMAKTEEISNSMKPTEQLALRIREIKRLVDMLENSL